MKTDFKNYINILQTLKETQAISIPENFDWVKSFASLLPNLSLDLPQIQKKSKINLVMDKKNPIYIQLDDGSKLFFTHDEFKRIEGKPAVGKNLLVTMQRLSNDNSDLPSKIVKCQII